MNVGNLAILLVNAACVLVQGDWVVAVVEAQVLADEGAQVMDAGVTAPLTAEDPLVLAAYHLVVDAALAGRLLHTVMLAVNLLLQMGTVIAAEAKVR